MRLMHERILVKLGVHAKAGQTSIIPWPWESARKGWPNKHFTVDREICTQRLAKRAFHRGHGNVQAHITGIGLHTPSTPPRYFSAPMTAGPSRARADPLWSSSACAILIIPILVLHGANKPTQRKYVIKTKNRTGVDSSSNMSG